MDEKPQPSAEEIEEAIAGNLCRCTGCLQIVEAIMRSPNERRDRNFAGESSGARVHSIQAGGIKVSKCGRRFSIGTTKDTRLKTIEGTIYVNDLLVFDDEAQKKGGS